MKNKIISVVGLGYIGLPAAAMFAAKKVKVIGIDVNQHAIDTINQGKIHIVEDGLETIVNTAVINGYLRATNKPEPADAFLIAVPTPFKANYEADLSYIFAAATNIAPVLAKGNVVILESTSPVGATEEMIELLIKLRPDLKFPINKDDLNVDVHVAYCPERVLPGQVVKELVSNDRIIGGMTPVCSQKAVDVYRIFVEGELLITDTKTAEMSKLTENAFRDVNIAFANELSIICDKLGINVWELIELANHHPRVNILQPGAGVGGHCIAVDPWFIVSKTPELAKLTKAAREVNDSKPEWVINKIEKAINNLGRLNRKPKLALLGLAFKPNIDDLRESPALKIAKNIIDLDKYEVVIVEPNIHTLPKGFEKVTLTSINTLDKADIIIILVNHKEFYNLNPSYNNKILNFISKKNNILDRIFDDK